MARPPPPKLRRRAPAPPLRAVGFSSMAPLGVDMLTFLASTVAVVPACRLARVSPVLGFLATGVALQQAG